MGVPITEQLQYEEKSDSVSKKFANFFVRIGFYEKLRACSKTLDENKGATIFFTLTFAGCVYLFGSSFISDQPFEISKPTKPNSTVSLMELIVKEKLKRLEDSDPVVVWWTKTPWHGYTKIIKCPCCNAWVDCVVSYNRSRPEVDAYLFYAPETKFRDLPFPRLPHTIWGLHADKPIENILEFEHDKAFNLFNYSSTFSRYSDVPIPLSWITDPQGMRNNLFIKTEAKNEMLKIFAPIVYMESNCQTSTRRNEYVKELMKYIGVDAYGDCLNKEYIKIDGPDSDAKDFDFRRASNVDKQRFISRYKFMITFDSVACSDYVSEDVWIALQSGVVPIYFGSPTILDWMPNPKSVILAEDFPTPKHLAAYLEELNKNDTAYEEYLLHKLNNTFCNKRLLIELTFRSYQKSLQKSVEKFECFVCKKLVHAIKSNFSNEKVRVVTKSQLNCSQSRSALPITLNTTASTTKQALLNKTKETVDKAYNDSTNWQKFNRYDYKKLLDKHTKKIIFNRPGFVETFREMRFVRKEVIRNGYQRVVEYDE